MAAPSATSAFLTMNLDNVDKLTDLDEIKKAYDQLCKEEVRILVVFEVSVTFCGEFEILSQQEG